MTPPLDNTTFTLLAPGKFADAAVTLSVMIEKRAREELPEDIRPYALNLSRLLLETIKEKAEVTRC
jgi:hypothetical protein